METLAVPFLRIFSTWHKASKAKLPALKSWNQAPNAFCLTKVAVCKVITHKSGKQGNLHKIEMESGCLWYESGYKVCKSQVLRCTANSMWQVGQSVVALQLLLWKFHSFFLGCFVDSFALFEDTKFLKAAYGCYVPVCFSCPI